jgi:hypothetical protein
MPAKLKSWWECLISSFVNEFTTNSNIQIIKALWIWTHWWQDRFVKLQVWELPVVDVRHIPIFCKKIAIAENQKVSQRSIKEYGDLLCTPNESINAIFLMLTYIYLGHYLTPHGWAISLMHVCVWMHMLACVCKATQTIGSNSLTPNVKKLCSRAFSEILKFPPFWKIFTNNYSMMHNYAKVFKDKNWKESDQKR